MNDINHKFYKLRWLREWVQQSESTRATLLEALINNASSSEKFDQNFNALIEFLSFEQSVLQKLKSFDTEDENDYRQSPFLTNLYRLRRTESNNPQ